MVTVPVSLPVRLNLQLCATPPERCLVLPVPTRTARLVLLPMASILLPSLTPTPIGTLSLEEQSDRQAAPGIRPLVNIEPPRKRQCMKVCRVTSPLNISVPVVPILVVGHLLLLVTSHPLKLVRTLLQAGRFPSHVTLTVVPLGVQKAQPQLPKKPIPTLSVPFFPLENMTQCRRGGALTVVALSTFVYLRILALLKTVYTLRNDRKWLGRAPSSPPISATVGRTIPLRWNVYLPPLPYFPLTPVGAVLPLTRVFFEIQLENILLALVKLARRTVLLRPAKQQPPITLLLVLSIMAPQPSKLHIREVKLESLSEPMTPATAESTLGPTLLALGPQPRTPILQSARACLALGTGLMREQNLKVWGPVSLSVTGLTQ